MIGRSGPSDQYRNIAYIRPIVTFGDERGLFLTLAPRVFSYIGSLDDNPDIAEFRGYADLRMVIGWYASEHMFGAASRSY